jgi:hypothetical protein
MSDSFFFAASLLYFAALSALVVGVSVVAFGRDLMRLW